MSSAAGGDEVLKLVSGTYDEVLDATKHQDDKIGRLFTGISFLTAAALAMANIGGSSLIRQGYRGWGGPPLAMVFLAVFLLLVVVAVMLLINSLATPLRAPGLSRTPPRREVNWANDVPASPLYFGEISRLRLPEWELKWDSSVEALETERRESLIGETHNLAARTQFKYGRTSEAIAVFNLALLSLSCTIVLILTAASVPAAAAGAPPPLPQFPLWPRFILAVVVALFYFVQLQGSVRYTRQTLDEIEGLENVQAARWRYGWVVSATAWAFFVASGEFRTGWRAVLVVGVGAVAVIALFWGNRLQRRRREREALARTTKDLATQEATGRAWGSWIALVLGLALTAVNVVPVGFMAGYEFAFGAALGGASAISTLSFVAPTAAQYRNKKRYEEDPERQRRLEPSAQHSTEEPPRD